MNVNITETCSCGAKLEFSESFEASWMSHAADRQAEFHKAHEKCRQAVPLPARE